jgi:TonB-dependent receptor
VIPTANSRNYQIVMTPQQFQDAFLGALNSPATATQLFNGAQNRPDSMIGNWTQLDVAKLFATVGAPNLNYDCVKACTGSDGKTYAQPKTSIKERTQAFYLMSDFNIDHLPFTRVAFPFGWEIEGNLGWRYVRTQVRGTGNMTFVSIQPTALFDPANPGAAAGLQSSSITKTTTVDATTHDFLPVYNLAMWVVPDKVVVRYSHGKTVARPGASLLIPAGTCTYDQTRLQGTDANNIDMSCSTVGNPALLAQTNINHNLSLEWYPNKDTMFTAAAYKQIGKIGPSKVDSLKGVKVFSGSDAVDPATGTSLANIPFDLRTYVNDLPSTRTGVEFSMKTAFTFLPWYLRYTGLDANVTRQHTSNGISALDLLSGATLAPAGVPKYSFNWALWYDDGKWSARIATQVVGTKFSCIAPCGDSLSGYSLNAYPNLGLGWKNPAYNPGPPNYSDRTSYVDGKIGYKFNKDWEFFLEGRNLTNRTQTGSIGSSAYADGTPNLQTYYYPGRRITIGLNYRNL